MLRESLLLDSSKLTKMPKHKPKQKRKKNLFPFSSMCVEFSTITAPCDTHTRNPSRFVDIREMLRLTSTKEEKQTEHTKKKSRKVSVDDGARTLAHSQSATVRVTL
uniref:(northern house mosquito) hypothetical protein n=1 Tax=Culex pipiens TaxID=7175 RepID=A0A8D8CAY8_CULPI